MKMNSRFTDTTSAVARRVAKTIRPNEIRGQTSCFAGKVVPHAYIPLLREEQVGSSRIRVKIDMTETVETLMNPVAVTTRAVFVPFLAFERFEGSLDRFNRSYKGEPDKEGGDVVPFIAPINFDRNAEIFRTMGIHAKQGDPINSALVEAYNCWVNFRRKQISKELPQRTPLDTTLANCEWRNTTFRSIVPDFDQAAIDGEVELRIAERVRVSGIGSDGTTASVARDMYETETGYRQVTGWSGTNMTFQDAGGLPAIYAELAQDGVKLSLSNIELAKKTAWMATQRKKHAGLDDDHIIDMLMDGIRVPDAQLSQPIVLDRKTTLIGYNRRWATDSGNLEKSVTTGETMLNLTIRTPPMNTGGIILIVSEIVPEQLFERQRDHFLHTMDPDDWPSATRDELDPEKVDVIQNKDVDVEQTDPDGTFGYSYLNSRWDRSLVNIGGKYYRQLGDPFDENRQKIWAVETVDPALTSDFYLANNLHHKVFADATAEPFEINTIGSCRIITDMVRGKRLEENTDDYNILIEQADDTRIDQSA
ncbi:hypothetical protein [Roseobacter sp. MH60115]|uniref:hypothetical protein n=1 Tax=Roseobacter sp. MH60115 TaxID=2785324 RepID=UPI0018A26AC0|nr:hypothetical protein [Roseobacter sp. MH60115]